MNMVRGGDHRREERDVSGGVPLLERTWIPAFAGKTGSNGKKSPAPAATGVSDGRTTPTYEVLSDDPALDLWVRQTVGTSRDVSGTCKIGPDADPMAVVDQECRVKGVTGLWVADSSVMPHVVRANTNATAIMIGERVADWVGNS